MLPSCDPSSSELHAASEAAVAVRPAETKSVVWRMPTPEMMRKWAEPVVRFRWQIATVGALCVAMLSWIPRWGVPESPEVDEASEVSEVSEVSEQAPVVSQQAPVVAHAESRREAPAAVKPEAALIPGLTNARALTEDQIALSAPIPKPPRDVPKPPSRDVPKSAVVPHGRGDDAPPLVPHGRGDDAPPPLVPPARTDDAVPLAPEPQAQSVATSSVTTPAVTTTRPHGTLKVRSQPAGAMVVCDGREIGRAPLEWPLRPGRHEVSAEWKGRDARTRAVTIANGADQSLNFDFRSNDAPAKTISRRSKRKKKEDNSMLAKVTRSVKDFFDGDRRR